VILFRYDSDDTSTPALPFLVQICFAQVNISVAQNSAFLKLQSLGWYHLSFESRKVVFMYVCMHKDKRNHSTLSKDKIKLLLPPL